VDADTSAEEEEVADAQNALEEIRKSQVDLKQAIEEKKPQIKEIQDILMEITERNKKVLEDLQKAEDALSRWYSERDQQQAKLQRKREKMEQYNNIIEQVRSFRVFHL
jgi:chromosome segregation ATPase